MSRMDNPSGGEQGQANLGEAATQMGQQIRDMGSQVRDQATQRYGELRDQAMNYYEEGRQRATEWEQDLEQYIHQKPIQAVLMAAGVGVLLGLLWKRS